MTSQEAFDRHVEAQRGIRRLVTRDLQAWATLEGVTREGAREFLPLLVASYGEVSAAVAADHYEDARAESGVAGRYSATMATADEAEVRRRLGWAFAGTADDVVPRMSALADELTLQVGRDTLMRSAQRDPAKPRFARIPVGRTCAWCLMLASRGPVYRSAASAGAGRRFHDDCDCQPEPSWQRGGADLPESYDMGALYDLYSRARTAAGSGDPRKVTAAFRRLDGGRHVNDGVAAAL